MQFLHRLRLDTADYGDEVGLSCPGKIMKKELGPALENLRPKGQGVQVQSGLLSQKKSSNVDSIP